MNDILAAFSTSFNLVNFFIFLLQSNTYEDLPQHLLRILNDWTKTDWKNDHVKLSKKKEMLVVAYKKLGLWMILESQPLSQLIFRWKQKIIAIEKVM